MKPFAKELLQIQSGQNRTGNRLITTDSFIVFVLQQPLRRKLFPQSKVILLFLKLLLETHKNGLAISES